METIIILIFTVTNIGTLLLFRRMAKNIVHIQARQGVDARLHMRHEMRMAEYSIDIEERLDRIDQDHQQIKTRLADEERQDQAEKRKARRQVR